MVCEVYIYFSGNSETVALPVNPEQLEIKANGRNITEEVVGTGEINILRTPSLDTLTIESYFPKNGTLDFIQSFRTEQVLTKSADAMFNFFDTAYRNKKPLKMVVTRLNISMIVGIENLTRINKAGEHDDIYFKMDLKKWLPYGVRVLQKDSEGNLTEGKSLQNDVEFAIDNKKVPTAVKVLSGETSLWEEAAKATGSGDNWEDIYKASADVLGNGLGSLAGKTIKIPTELSSIGKVIKL